MNIFISHSSKDKWAARVISETLIANGATTFLDEKDIETGASIDAKIKEHLNSCTDFLVLLSPASVKSEWVLIELGGAIALGKNIVPILLYVGPNDIPKVISLKLARDINEISKYIDEVKFKLTGAKARPKTRKPETAIKAAEPILTIGQKVRIISKPPSDSFSDTKTLKWNEEMNSYLGEIAAIVGIDEDGDYQIDIDNQNWFWDKKWLFPVE